MRRPVISSRGDDVEGLPLAGGPGDGAEPPAHPWCITATLPVASKV